jgi:hypothetical protein
MSEEEITKIGKSFLDLVTKIRFKMTRFDLLFLMNSSLFSNPPPGFVVVLQQSSSRVVDSIQQFFFIC